MNIMWPLRLPCCGINLTSLSLKNIHVQGQCLVPMVSFENLYGGCGNFFESAHGVGFYTDNLYINKCII